MFASFWVHVGPGSRLFRIHNTDYHNTGVDCVTLSAMDCLMSLSSWSCPGGLLDSWL